MLEKLRNGKYANKIATADEVKSFVEEAERMVRIYGWEERDVFPWSVPEKVTKTIRYIADYPQCTFSSKQMLISLANGLVNVMNAWERTEIEGVLVRVSKTGKIVKVMPEDAAMYVELGIGEAV